MRRTNRVSLDQEICLCFHVTRRKIVNFLRVEQPRRASQLSECGGAGTGCGWCRPYLERLFAAATAERDAEIPAAERYAQDRQNYIREGKGTPPPPPPPSPSSSPSSEPRSQANQPPGEASFNVTQRQRKK